MRRAILALSVLMAMKVGAGERAMIPEDAKMVFERFKSFAGSWKAESTQGWTESNRYEVAAKGSVVVNRSIFEGEANDGMLTTIYMDGDRLLMTHYCEARNQPTLVAATIDDESKRVVFKFLRGTNMKSRDVGHMDSVVYQFIDDDHFRSRWSWYANGEERWLEDIALARAK